MPQLRRDHPCAAAFLDETGAISQDRFFAVGLLKSRDAPRLLRGIQKLRDREHWYGEIKFTDLTRSALPFYRRVVDLCLEPGLAEFFCFVADRDVADPVARFGSPWHAYGKLAEQLVTASLHPGELLALMADNYSTPDHILFEEDLRASVNRRLRRLGLVSVCRLDSRSSDGLQAVDLLISATAFEFRANSGLASHTSPKGILAAYVRRGLGAESCLTGWRNASHSVAVYGHGVPSPPSG
jgi:hypothetical protein